MKLTAIIALSDDGLIGLNGKLPWSIPEDMKHFRTQTTGHAIIMGRKTHESIGVALPKRRNIVVSNKPDLKIVGCEVSYHPLHAVRMAWQTDPNPFVIGGGEIYQMLWDLCTDLIVTEVHQTFKPAVSNEMRHIFTFQASQWRKVKQEDLTSTSGTRISFVTYDREEGQ